LEPTHQEMNFQAILEDESQWRCGHVVETLHWSKYTKKEWYISEANLQTDRVHNLRILIFQQNCHCIQLSVIAKLVFNSEIVQNM